MFNFFRLRLCAAVHRPGHGPASGARSFSWSAESSVGGYLNYMQGVIRNGIYCQRPDVLPEREQYQQRLFRHQDHLPSTRWPS